MALALALVKFVAIPAIAIVALGAALRFFRPQIIGAAQATGEVFTSIFTEPIRAGIENISTAFSDLPDIDVRIPGFSLAFGEIDIQNPFEGFQFPSLGGGDSEAPAPPSTPPELGRNDPRRDTEPGLTLLGGSLPVSLAGGTQRLSRSDIIEQFPDTIALFDVLATPQTEFLPFSEAGVRSALEQGLELRVTGQLFRERPGAALLAGA